MNEIIKLITGRYTGQELMKILDELLEELIHTPEQRFNLLMQCHWLYWNSQSWNQNFSGKSFEYFRNQFKFKLKPFDEYEGSYDTIWIHTRTKVWEKNFKPKTK